MSPLPGIKNSLIHNTAILGKKPSVALILLSWHLHWLTGASLE